MQNIRACTFFSGSSANCAYIEINGRAILIDAGGGIRKTSEYLNEIGSNYDKIDAVFVTHEHSDHINGLAPICNRFNIPIISNANTLRAIAKAQPSINTDLFRPMPTGAKAVRNDFEVTSFATSHDSAESVGYIIKTNQGNIGVVTDLGQYTEEVEENVSSCKILILEANHDEQMLRTGRYPYFLKKRISGNSGHLSNVQSGNLLSSILHKGVKKVMLAHLSCENNTPSLALSSVSDAATSVGAIVGGDIMIDVAPRNGISKIMDLVTI